jgi:hypothetical protein
MLMKKKYPFMNVIEQCPEDSKIISVARSHFHLLQKTDEFKKGLEKGLTFELACADPQKITPYLTKVSLLYDHDIESALTDLRELWSCPNFAERYIYPTFQ